MTAWREYKVAILVGICFWSVLPLAQSADDRAGARAASAGFILAIAADVSVMAPGTHIGASPPLIDFLAYDVPDILRMLDG